jgi:hypothetical protein
MNSNQKSNSSVIPPVGVVKALNAVQSFFYKLAKRMVPPSVWMTGIAENYWLSRGVVTIIELNIPDHINEGNNTIEKLSACTGADKDALYRLMRMLCSHEIFKLKKDGTYSLTQYSRVLLEEKDSVKYFILGHLGKLHNELFSDMKNTILTGQNASDRLYGKDIFARVKEIPQEHEAFIKGMADTSNLFAPVMLASYDFSPYSLIVDIGGGHGSLLSTILGKNQKSRGILFDAEHVVIQADDNLKKAGVENRVEIIQGDFFTEVPANGDIYIMKNILHDWNDGDAARILKNVYRAMPENSKLLVIEALISNDNRYSFGKMIDVLMLVVTREGRERTKVEFERLFQVSGFKIKRIIPTVSPFSVIECIKS